MNEELMDCIIQRCPNCDDELVISHVFDHIMGCEDCKEEVENHIFNHFSEMGVAVSITGIGYVLELLDDYILQRLEGRSPIKMDCLDNLMGGNE